MQLCLLRHPSDLFGGMGPGITPIELDLTDRQPLHPHIRRRDLGARSATASHAQPFRSLLFTPPARLNSHIPPMSRWIAVVGPACLQAHPRRHLGTSQIGKNYLGGLTKRFSAWRAARLIPKGPGGLNSVAPAILEAINRYVKMLSAVFLHCGFRPARTIWRSLHFPRQISITSALPRAPGEWPWHSPDLGEVRRAK